MGSENGSMPEKECVVLFNPYLIVPFPNPPLSVEAHSPFVQCVAWAPAPLTEGSEDTDRILNVVATGGTDKVKMKIIEHHVHPLTLQKVIKIWRP